MDYFLLIVIVLFAGSVIEMLPVQKPLRDGLWVMAFLFTAFICTIKYCYGVDYLAYQMFYVELPPVEKMWVMRQLYPDHEIGFYVYSCWCKELGLSFWAYTAIPSVCYFSAIFMLLNRLKNYRCLVLLILFVFCKDLILEQMREAMAIAFFVFAYLLYERKVHLFSLGMLALVVLVHKSGFVFVGLFVMAHLLRNIHISYKLYYALIPLMCATLVMNPIWLAQYITDLLPTKGDFFESIVLHMSMASKVQMVFGLYVVMFVLLALNARRKVNETGTMATMVFFFAGIIAVLYPYYLILNRFVSYMLPFLFVVVFQYVDEAFSETTMRERIVSFRVPVLLVMFLFVSYRLYTYQMYVKEIKEYSTFEYTLLDVDDSNRHRIEGSRRTQASYFWTYIYKKKAESNKLNIRQGW